MNITFQRKYLKKRYPLEISRGVIRGSENLFVFVEDQGVVGVGELAGTDALGGETCDTGEAEIGHLLEEGVDGLSIAEVWDKARDLGVRPRAQAALDMALWDLFGKVCGQPLWRVFGLSRRSVPTSVTIGINTPEIILERVPEILERTGAKFLKVKLGSPNGVEFDQESYLSILTAVEGFEVGLRVDANGGWDLAGAKRMCAWLAERGADYVEQPLVKGAEDQLPELFDKRPLPIYVDESIWFAEDIPALADRVDGVNLKLMKCGGITEALRIVATARAHGLGTMIGCMGESTVSISAGASLGAVFDHIDLDSQLNLVNDPAIGAEMIDGVVTPSNSPGHGAVLTDV